MILIEQIPPYLLLPPLPSPATCTTNFRHTVCVVDNNWKKHDDEDIVQQSSLWKPLLSVTLLDNTT